MMKRSARPALAAAAVFLLAALPYQPGLEADFILFDDPRYVSDNTLLETRDGLMAIWNPATPSLPQYYPLVFTSYWIEHQIWGRNPRVYHVTNVLLHGINGALVFHLTRSLGFGSWLALCAALLFAWHPAQVESVVWVSERKNTLSGLFYLLALLSYLAHRERGSEFRYVAALVFFIAALLSKTQTATLPLVLLISDGLLQAGSRLPRVRLRSLVGRIAPLVLLALIASVVTTQVEQRNWPSWVVAPALLDRLVVAANAAWFYVFTFLAPVHLAPMYPRWSVQTSHPSWWVAVAAWPLVAASLVWWWNRLPSRLLLGLAVFLVSLAPILGFVPFTFQDFTFVADRFLYHSSIGGGIVAASALHSFATTDRRRIVAMTGAFLILMVCAVATFSRCFHWRDNLSFWSYAVERNPDGYVPNMNLGSHYRRAGQWAEAVVYFRKASEVRATSAQAFAWYAHSLAVTAPPQEVARVCTERIDRGVPYLPIALFYRAQAYEALGRRKEALRDYESAIAASREASSWKLRAQQRLVALSDH